jgi:pyruvate dehydrogenase E2 component (dihydrolipoamide acetyltransferase)
VDRRRRGGPILSVSGAKGETTLVEPSAAERTVARRVAESRATIPTLELSVGRPRAGELATGRLLHACALALREHPRANGAYRDGRFELYSRINVGIAVAAENSLVVPTIFDADVKSLGNIASDARALAERVRAGAITPPELSGGTFTVSNLGMFGIDSFTAVINPPQAAILAVGAVNDVPVVNGGQIVPGKRMSMTLCSDHRILYGADAAQFLVRIRQLLEHPAALAL